jgi:hypothetical protein
LAIFGIDSTTLLAILSGLFTLILIVFAILQMRSSREVAKASEKLASAINVLQTASLVLGQNATSLTEATRTFSSAVSSLSVGTQTLAKIESEPRMEYVQKKKDLKLGGIEFDLVNKGKGTAYAVKVTPTSGRGVQLGLSFLDIRKSDIVVGESRSYLLTSVKEGDLISLKVEFKDRFGESCAPQIFHADTS